MKFKNAKYGMKVQIKNSVELNQVSDGLIVLPEIYELKGKCLKVVSIDRHDRTIMVEGSRGLTWWVDSSWIKKWKGDQDGRQVPRKVPTSN